MKKTLPILFLLPCLICFGQTTTTSREKPFAQFGIKGGLNLADIKSDLYPNHESKLDFHAGVLAHIHINPHVAIQPEVTYSRQGFKQPISTTLDLEVKTDYINIPVLFQYMYKGVRLETGPQVGFLVNAEGEYNDGRVDQLKNYLKSVDFSWDFGASYLTPFGIGVSARYNLGVSNINDGIKVAGVTNDDINHRVWQFGLFYQFRR